MVSGPGVTPGARCGRPVELLDLFPTLADLAGLQAPKHLEGVSLRAQLSNATAPRNRPAITTHNQGNHALRDEQYRYIRYADGSEELYDMVKDPHEWTNLAGRAESASIKAAMARWLPKTDVPAAPGSAHRVLQRDPATGTVTWEGERIGANDTVPTP